MQVKKHSFQLYQEPSTTTIIPDVIQYSPIVALSICFIIAIATGSFLTYTMWHLTLSRHRSALPFAITVPILHTLLYTFSLSASSIAGVIATFAAYLSFRLFQHPAPQGKLFHIGILWGIASIFSAGILPYILILVISLTFCQIANIKNILAIFLGVLFSLWSYFCYLALMGNPMLFFSHFVPLTEINLLNILSLNLRQWYLVISFMTLWICCFFTFKIHASQEKIKARTSLNLCFFLSIILVISYLMASFDDASTLILSMLIFTLPASHYFSYSQSKLRIILFYISLSSYLLFAAIYG